MKREFSAGGIVFNKNGQILLIQNSSIKDHKINYWGFPKGHINLGESSKEAALREVREETGIEVKIVGKVGDSKYVYTSADKGKIFKVVIIYLMDYVSGKLKFQQEELLDAKWFNSNVALKILSFSRDRELLQKVLLLGSDNQPKKQGNGPIK